MLEGTLSAPIGQSRVWLLVPTSIDVLRVQCQYQRYRVSSRRPKRVVMLCRMLAFTMRGGERLPANDLFWPPSTSWGTCWGCRTVPTRHRLCISGSAQEFDETPNWRGFQVLAVPAVVGGFATPRSRQRAA